MCDIYGSLKSSGECDNRHGMPYPKEQMIYPSFAQFLNNSKGIDKTFQYGSLKFNSRKDLTLDDILDKILVSGTSSLTDFEKSFLEQQSNQI